MHKLVAGGGCCMHAASSGDDANMLLSDLELTKQLDSSLLRCLELFEGIGNCRCQMKVPLREVSSGLAKPRVFSAPTAMKDRFAALLHIFDPCCSELFST
eukprot:SAG31_NODE_2506_length_5591_cov_4.701384_4_plen_100_part_00